MQWSIVSVWERLDEDHGQRFQAQSVLLSQNGEQLLVTSVTEFSIDRPVNFHRVIDEIRGFPIWAPGRLELRLMLRPKEKGDFQQKASFPILLWHDSATAH